MSTRIALVFAVIALVSGTPQVSSAIIMQPGDTVLFQFDIGSADLSSVNEMNYQWSIPSPVTGWDGKFTIYDELNTAPIDRSESNGAFFSNQFAQHLDRQFQSISGLFDDPISYILLTIDRYDPGEVVSADVNIDLYKTNNRIPANLLAHGQPISLPVPEPSASFLLLGSGLAGLGGMAWWRHRRS